MNIVAILVFASLGAFALLTIYNIVLVSREKVEKIQFRKGESTNGYDYEKSAKILKKEIGVFSHDTVYVFAGEFNYEMYDKLLDEELLGILQKNKIKLVAIGGPYISIPAKGGSNKIVEWAQKGYVDLYLRKDGKRTLGHGFVAEKSNSVCLLEDPHDEFDEREMTVFKNSYSYCNYLRDKVSALMSDDMSDRVADISDAEIVKYLKTKEEIVQDSSKVADDDRVIRGALLKPMEDALQERKRLKCLALTA